MISPLFRPVWLFLLAWLLAACSSGNVITWETASEVGTAGFNLYRGPSPDGPWTQINDALIPPAADPVRGGRYSFTDAAAERGQVYYYQLEEVELTGGVNHYPPTRLQNDDRGPVWIAVAITGALALALGWWGAARRHRHRPPAP